MLSNPEFGKAVMMGHAATCIPVDFFCGVLPVRLELRGLGEWLIIVRGLAGHIKCLVGASLVPYHDFL